MVITVINNLKQQKGGTYVNKKLKPYEHCEIEVVELKNCDVIATSGSLGDEPGYDEDAWT